MTTITLGPYTQYEIPEPYTLTFYAADGETPLWTAATAWDAWLVVQRPDGTVVSYPATVDADGVVTHTWASTHLAAVGTHAAEFWATNGTNRYASEPIEWATRAALIDPASLS